MTHRCAATAVTIDNAPRMLRIPSPTDDKYSRGVLGMVTGSVDYPGAALLGVNAALATGVGMVRFLGPEPVSSLVLRARPEVVLGPGRINALVVGSGFSDVTREGLLERLGALPHAATPAVVDAGAMVHREVFTGLVILTPHAGELERLARHFGAPQVAPQEQATWLASHLDAVVVLKGQETLVVSPDGRASRLPPAPSWLATAGTGDVLAGIMGAVLTAEATCADGVGVSATTCHDVAIVAGLIHQEAAKRESSLGSGSAPLLASDLAVRVREVVSDWLANR